MTPLHTASRFCRLVLLLCLSGCQTWRPVALAPAPLFGRKAAVRVNRVGQKPVVFAHPRVVGDSLVGRREGTSLPIAMALADVQRAEERRFSLARTMSLVLVGGVLAAVVAAGLADNSGYGLGCPSGQRTC